MNSDRLTAELLINYKRMTISYDELNKALALVHSALDRIETNESLCGHYGKAVSEIVAMMNEINDGQKPIIEEFFKRTQWEADE